MTIKVPGYRCLSHDGRIINAWEEVVMLSAGTWFYDYKHPVSGINYYRQALVLALHKIENRYENIRHQQ